MLLLSLVCARSWSTFQLRQQREGGGGRGRGGDGSEPARPSTVDPGALMLYKVVVATREREREGEKRQKKEQQRM